MSSGQKGVKIRRARASDAERIAVLSGQLGYPTTAKQMSARLRSVLRDKDGTCFVAETKEGGVVGWVQASITPMLVVERHADVDGLVVDETVRGRGVGAKLMQVLESWARKKGCKGMSVRSNVIRQEAHAFYEKQGYEHYKTQKALRKSL
jgi:GNAT superfamily N-acetyltransferase